MSSVNLPEDCAKQWEILLLLLSSEEKKIDRTGDGEVETMSYFCRHEGIRKIFSQWLRQMKATYARKLSESDTALKCDDVSHLWRQRGNDKFRANALEDSYWCYTKSVMFAHQDGPMYPLALANRSAALLKLKRYQECLSDVLAAVKSGYPLEQRHKLMLRRADCHIELGQKSLALTAIQEAVDHAVALKLNETHQAEFDRHVKILERKLEALGDEDPVEEPLVLPELFMGPNEDFHAASKAIEIRCNDTSGRHVVTTHETRRGDVLFCEEPYAWVALSSDTCLVCEHCCKPDINAIPCTRCSRAAYCSEQCRELAQPVHRWECSGAQCSLFTTIGIAHLALRVLLITWSTGFPPLPAGGAATTAADLFRNYSSVDNVNVYKSTTPPFYRMFNLVTNFDKMNNADYVQYALTATMLTVYLESFTSFFEQLPSRMPVRLSDCELRLFAAALILRSLGQLVCNGHAALSLATVEDDDGRTLTEKEVRRATAIYPSAAMMNHSCDPNIINTFYNNRLYIRCARELAPEAEVWNCYGPHRARAPAAVRRARLAAQYAFTCACAACRDTDRKDFVLLFSSYACQSCKGPVSSAGQCQQCRAVFQLPRALATLDTAQEIMLQAERATSPDVRCERAHAAFRLRQQVWHRHNAALRAAADRLARLYADAGEFGKCVELIKQNIQSLEYQFGSFSVEVAHELRKLSDVMLERIVNSPQHPDYRDWCLEAHKIIKKAVQLMELNYGSWEPLVKRLKEQEGIVGSFLNESRIEQAVENVHQKMHYNLKI